MDQYKTIEAVVRAGEILRKAGVEIEATIDAVKKDGLSPAAVYYFELRTAYDAMDAARKTVYKHMDFMSKSVIPEMMTAQGIDKFQVPEIGRSFYPLTKYSASMIDKEKGYGWLKDRGAGSLIGQTVSASALAAYFKDLSLEENVEPPEDIFKFGSYTITGMSKYTPK